MNKLKKKNHMISTDAEKVFDFSNLMTPIYEK